MNVSICDILQYFAARSLVYVPMNAYVNKNERSGKQSAFLKSATRRDGGRTFGPTSVPPHAPYFLDGEQQLRSWKFTLAVHQ